MYILETNKNVNGFETLSGVSDAIKKIDEMSQWFNDHNPFNGFVDPLGDFEVTILKYDEFMFIKDGVKTVGKINALEYGFQRELKMFGQVLKHNKVFCVSKRSKYVDGYRSNPTVESEGFDGKYLKREFFPTEHGHTISCTVGNRNDLKITEADKKLIDHIGLDDFLTVQGYELLETSNLDFIGFNVVTGFYGVFKPQIVGDVIKFETIISNGVVIRRLKDTCGEYRFRSTHETNLITVSKTEVISISRDDTRVDKVMSGFSCGIRRGCDFSEDEFSVIFFPEVEEGISMVKQYLETKDAQSYLSDFKPFTETV